MFWAQFERLCTKAGMSPNAVAKELRIPSGSITAWKNGTEPRASTAKKIAERFGVTTEYLMFGDGEQKNPAATPGDGLDAEFREKYEMLTDEQKKFVEQMIDGILKMEGGAGK